MTLTTQRDEDGAHSVRHEPEVTHSDGRQLDGPVSKDELQVCEMLRPHTAMEVRRRVLRRAHDRQSAGDLQQRQCTHHQHRNPGRGPRIIQLMQPCAEPCAARPHAAEDADEHRHLQHPICRAEPLATHQFLDDAHLRRAEKRGLSGEQEERHETQREGHLCLMQHHRRDEGPEYDHLRHLHPHHHRPLRIAITQPACHRRKEDIRHAKDRPQIHLHRVPQLRSRRHRASEGDEQHLHEVVIEGIQRLHREHEPE